MEGFSESETNKFNHGTGFDWFGLAILVVQAVLIVFFFQLVNLNILYRREAV